MKEVLDKRLNAQQNIQKLLPEIIEAFVAYYGENNRNLIEEKFKKLIIVCYSDPIDFSSDIKLMRQELFNQLFNDFCKATGIYNCDMDNIMKMFFDTKSNIFSNNDLSVISWPISNFLGCSNLIVLQKNQIEAFIKLFNKDISEEEINYMIETENYNISSELKSSFERFVSNFYEKYEPYKKNLDYIDEREKVKKNLKKEYTQILSNEFRGIASENDKFNSIIDLVGKSIIEYFNEENSKLLIDGTDSDKKRIINKRIEFFKLHGIDLGDDYDKYANNERCISIAPTSELINRFNLRKKELFEEFNKKYYSLLGEYVNNKNNIDKIGFINKTIGYSELSYVDKISCIQPNLIMGSNGCELFSLASLKANSLEDGILIHELNHVVETLLVQVNNGTYTTICGWDYSVDEIDSKPDLYDHSTKRNYELFNEIINELLAQDITKLLHDRGVFVLDETGNHASRFCDYLNLNFLAKDFFELNKEEIIESRLNHNFGPLFNKVGRENFEKLNSLFLAYFSKFGLTAIPYIDYKSNKDTPSAKYVAYLIEQRDIILQSMQEYSQKKSL